MNAPRPFDLCAAELPLGPGRWLLEASAGTGKTYTIVGIVLRLLAADQIRIDRCVLMTFTRAATAELRERLRQGLSRAVQVLEGRAPAGEDPLLQCLQQHGDPAVVARRLRRALVDCDGALIATIHGFCHRILHDHALHTGVPLAAELDADLSAWRQRCIHDLLRDWNHRLSHAAACLVAPALDPITLQERAQLLERHPEVTFVDEAIDAATVDARLALVRERWPTWRSQIADFFQDRAAVLGTAYGPRELADRLDRIGRCWDNLPDHALLDDLLRPLIDPACSTGQRRQLAQQEWHRTILQLMRCRYGVEQHLLEDYRDALRCRARQQEHLHFSDLLHALDACLDGPAGADLQRAVQERYQIALVDEFQDTDQLQWRIFERLFSARQQRLILIGDPKQAIYGFRGADVQAYLHAAATVADERRFTLATNFRSDIELVQATNAFFDRGPTTFVEPDIPFYPVQARHERRLDDPQQSAALQIWWHPFDGRAEQVRRHIADLCAVEIARLLHDARRHDGNDWCALRPPDIAVLVTSHRQGDLIAQALRRLPRPIASVRNLRTSIFTTRLASDVAQVLAAVLAPHQERRVRSAAVSCIGGLDLADLTDPARTSDRETIMLRLRELRLRWREEGFAIVWQAILDQGIGLQPARVLAATAADGERTLTDLLHLGDLLTRTVVEQGLGPDALLQWLESQIASPAFDDEEQHLRLERDDDAVRIMTIHGSKGLEFPVVFAPFLWSSPRVDDSPLVNEQGAWRWYVAPLAKESARNRQLRATQRRDGLAEAVRLAYVACTRARHRCYLSFAPQRPYAGHAGCSAAPLTWLAWAAEAGCEAGHLQETVGPLVTEDDWQRAVQAGLRCGGQDHLRLTIDPVVAEPPLETALPATPGDGDTDADSEGLAAWRSPRRQRFFSSYSGLIRNRPVEEPDYDQLRHRSADDPAPTTELPRGPRFGSALHLVLELIDFTADAATISAQCRTALISHGLDGNDAPTLAQLIVAVLRHPLPDRPDSDLRRCAERRLAELEVLLPAIGSDAIAAVFAAHGGRWADYAADIADLRIPPGFFVAIIDLIFVDQGRYHILDWKSNDLGAKGGYGREAIERDMRQHHYVLQYHLYLVALQRYLRLRLPDYDAARHLGSAYYLFVRGVGSDPGDPTAGWYVDRPSQAMIDGLEACFGGEHG